MDNNYDDWKAVYTSGTDYEAELVADRLRDADIPVVVLNKRDHAYNLTIGDMAQIDVMVPADNAQEATDLLSQAPLTDEELEKAALAASPFDEDGESDDE